MIKKKRKNRCRYIALKR